MYSFSCTGGRQELSPSAKSHFHLYLVVQWQPRFLYPKLKEQTYHNLAILWTWTSQYACMNRHTCHSGFLYYISIEVVVKGIRYSNFWAATASVNTRLVLSSTKVGEKKKRVRKRIFNLVSTTWVIIRNDSWTWWNCIPNWKTKLLSDQHDFLVLGPC